MQRKRRTGKSLNGLGSNYTNDVRINDNDNGNGSGIAC